MRVDLKHACVEYDERGNVVSVQLSMDPRKTPQSPRLIVQ